MVLMVFFSKLHLYSLQKWGNIRRNRNFLAFEEHDIYDVIMLFNLWGQCWILFQVLMLLVVIILSHCCFPLIGLGFIKWVYQKLCSWHLLEVCWWFLWKLSTDSNMWYWWHKSGKSSFPLWQICSAEKKI